MAAINNAIAKDFIESYLPRTSLALRRFLAPEDSRRSVREFPR